MDADAAFRVLSPPVMWRRILPVLLLAAASARPAGDPTGWTPAQKEHFLLTARVIGEKPAGKGVTHSLKALLGDGRVTHDAHVQTVDVYKPLFKGKDGSEERDFKDSWKFDVAAYRLAKLLGLAGVVPPCVERVIDGKPAAVGWWVDRVMMDERERKRRNVRPPDMARWNRQMDTVRIFDQLIYNMDRSEENLLITSGWQVWMIDHTRAFRRWPTLRNPAAVTRCDPDLFAHLRNLKRHDVARELGPFLTPAEIDGLLSRRDLIVAKLRPGLPSGQ